MSLSPPTGPLGRDSLSLTQYSNMASILDQYLQASAGENLNPFLGPDTAEPVSEMRTHILPSLDIKLKIYTSNSIFSTPSVSSVIENFANFTLSVSPGSVLKDLFQFIDRFHRFFLCINTDLNRIY